MIHVFKNTAIAFLCALAIIVAGVCLLIVLSIAGQRRKEREDEQAMVPSINWVNTFEGKRGRLPSNEEFLSRPDARKGDNSGMWLDVDGFFDCPQKPIANKNSPPFCVQIWRGEDTMHYHSWDGKYFIVDPPQR